MQELIDRFKDETPRMRVVACDECVAEEVAAVLHEARPVKYGAAIAAAPGVRVTLLDAGHIPGSASILFEVSFGEKKRRVLFSGDLGNGLSPLAAGPRPAPAVDAVYVECTYGTIRRKASVRSEPASFRRAVAERLPEGASPGFPAIRWIERRRFSTLAPCPTGEAAAGPVADLLPFADGQGSDRALSGTSSRRLVRADGGRRRGGLFAPRSARHGSFAQAAAASVHHYQHGDPDGRSVDAATFERLAARAVDECPPGGVSGPRHGRRAARCMAQPSSKSRGSRSPCEPRCRLLVFFRPRRRRRHRRMAGQRTAGRDRCSGSRRPARIEGPRPGASQPGATARAHRPAGRAGGPAINARRRESPPWIISEKCE